MQINDCNHFLQMGVSFASDHLTKLGQHTMQVIGNSPHYHIVLTSICAINLHKLYVNPLVHKYSFWHINTRQLLKTLWEKQKLIINKQFFLFLQCFLHNQIIVSHLCSPFQTFSTLSDNCIPFVTSYFYLLMNSMSLQLAYEVKGY